MNQKRIGIALLMAATSALFRYHTFAQTPYANGWDSYFYLVQVKSWVEQGAMHSPEASLIYPFLRGVLFLTGDYVQMYQMGAALLAGLFTLMMMVVAQLFGNARSNYAPMLIGAWTMCSPQLSYVAAQYPKNLLGLVLWLFFVAVLEKKGTSRWAFALLAVNYFGHRLTFALALLYGFWWLLLRYQLHLQAWFNRKTGFAAGLLLLSLGVAMYFFPGLFHFADMGRVGNVLHWPPQFAPYTFLHTFGWERLTAWWVLEITLVTLGWVALGLFFLPWAKNQVKVIRPPIIALWLLCGCLLFPFLVWSYTDVSYRFFLVFILIGPLLGSTIKFNASKKHLAAVYAGAALLVLGGYWIQAGGYRPKWHDPDYAAFNRITQLIQGYFDKNKLEKPELLICHNALAEYFTFSSGTDAMPWLPEYPVDSSRLWRLAAGIHPQTLRYFVGGAEKVPLLSLGNGYVLLRENDWQRAVQRAQTERDLFFLQNARNWLNPYKKRPEWLLKRKKSPMN